MFAWTAILRLALAASPVEPSAAQGPGSAEGQAFDVRLSQDQHDRMTVAVRVADSGPYAFLVDTGAERTVISRELAGKLGLLAGARTMLTSVLATSAVSTVDIPLLRVTNSNVAVRNAPALASLHIGADGMLGVDTLATQRVLFDFKNKIMRIAPAQDRAEWDDANTIVVRARRKHGRLLFTSVLIDRHEAIVVVDTGSQISIGNAALKRRLFGARTLADTVEMQTVVGERIMAEVGTIHDLELGGVTLKEMKIAFTDAPVFRQLDIDTRPALLLGMNAMRAFDRVSIDFATRKVRFVLPGTSMREGLKLAWR